MPGGIAEPRGNPFASVVGVVVAKDCNFIPVRCLHLEGDVALVLPIIDDNGIQVEAPVIAATC